MVGLYIEFSELQTTTLLIQAYFICLYIDIVNYWPSSLTNGKVLQAMFINGWMFFRLSWLGATCALLISLYDPHDSETVLINQ